MERKIKRTFKNVSGAKIPAEYAMINFVPDGKREVKINFVREGKEEKQ